MTTTFSLRPAQDADQVFLDALFVEARSVDLMLDALPPALAEDLLALQLTARNRDRARLVGAVDQVIEADGRPVGRIVVAETSTGLRVSDVGVLASERGRGAATYAVESWARYADETGRAMTLQVAFGNPAARIYSRLGFLPVAGEDVTQQAMRREPQIRETAHA